MKKIIAIFVILAMAFVQTSCNKDDDTSNPNDPDRTGSECKGIGKSLEIPTGTPFNLPNGIELTNNTIKGYDRNECGCEQNNEECRRGSGIW